MVFWDDDVDLPLLKFEIVNDTNRPPHPAYVMRGISLLLTRLFRYTSLDSFFALAVAIMCLRNTLLKSFLEHSSRREALFFRVFLAFTFSVPTPVTTFMSLL